MGNNKITEEERIMRSVIDGQRKLIEDCEKDGKSYKGGDGSFRRRADVAALSNLEKRLAKMTEDEE
jgi:hypothetical protein